MGHSRKVRLGALLALGVTAAAMLPTAATAGPPFGETIHEEGEFVVEDFCDEEGLDVEIAFVSDVRVQGQPRGNAGLLYFMQHGKLTETITNLANDKFVTTATTVLDKDLRVSDNGDGTLTILILATGNAVLYGRNGKVIASNPGQVRFEVVLDHGGTPTDPSDDVGLSFELVKGSTGRTDDFCAAAIAALS